MFRNHYDRMWYSGDGFQELMYDRPVLWCVTGTMVWCFISNVLFADLIMLFLFIYVDKSTA